VAPARAAFLCMLAAFAVAPSLVAQETPNPAEGLTVREIRFEGLTRTQEYVVTRELVSRVGQPYREENIAKEKVRLERLDIFVDIQVEAAVEGTEVVLTYRFVEILKFLPSLSIQITDENGISAGVGIKVPNFRGRDVSFSGRIMGGGSALGQIVVQNPWFIGNRIGYSFEYYYRDRQNLVADFLETSHELVLDINAPIGEYSRFGGNFDYLDLRSDTAGVTLSPDNHDRVTRIGAYLAYDKKDAFVGTHEGWYGEVRLSQELRLFESSSSFTQLDLDIRRYQPLPFGDRHTLTVSSLLSLRTGVPGTDVAPWQLFGMGGTNTVRGWEYASLVGKNQLIGTLEYSITLLKPRLINLPFRLRYRGGMQFCVFADAGTVWDEGRAFDSENVIAGWGFGLRLLVPIVGQVRLDFAWGGSGSGGMFHIGAYEKATMSRKRVR
jgi:outer membrane protein insertion porin family